MLELARRIGFGVDVGQLLELERTLHRHGQTHSPGDEKDAVPVGNPPSDALQPVLHGQDALHLAGKAAKLRQQTLEVGRGRRVQLETQEVEGDELAHEGLGGGHTHLRPRLRVQGVLHHSRDAAVWAVGERQGAIAGVAGGPGRRDGVRRLARLGDEDGPSVWSGGRHTLELGGYPDGRRTPAEGGQELRARQASIVGRPARGEEDASGRLLG